MVKAFRKFGLPLGAEVFPVFKKINDSLWIRIEKNTITREELHRIRWDLIFDELGVDFDGRTFEKEFRANLGESAIPVEGAEDILKYLSAKYEVYVASNASYNEQIRRLAGACESGFTKYFTDLFLSEKMGVAKPSREYFDKCVELCNGNVDEIIMIGDSLSADIVGAKEYGLKTIWFNYTGEDTVSPYADYTVLSLREIKNVL